MIRVKSLHELKKLPSTTESVYVQTVRRLFRYEQGEWIERAYYGASDVAKILGTTVRRTQHIIRKLGLKAPLMRQDRIHYTHLSLIIRAHRMKQLKPNLKYTEIRKELKL